jgi:hypothetical protein
MKPDTSKLFEEVNEKIGRNLLRYQYIEVFLKQIIPYTNTENKKQPYFFDDGVDLEKFREYQGVIQSQTFGPLIGEFKKFNKLPADFLIKP